MTGSVLLLERHRDEEEGLERHLSDHGYAVVRARRTREALELMEAERPDVVLLYEVELCRRVREGEPGRAWDRRVPLIVLVPPEAAPADRVRALDGGADDVVARPIVYLELLARIRALLRRSRPVGQERIVAADVAVDRRTRRVTVSGRAVALAGKEFELVATLASDPSRVFTKEELLRDVWGYRTVVRTRTLDSHASRLRRKLNDAADAERYVVNVWGVGYRLVD